MTVLANDAVLSPQPDIHWEKDADENTWTYSITGLPRYQKGTNTNADYSVQEAPVAGYTRATDAPATSTDRLP